MAKMVATASFVAEVAGEQINVSANVTRADENDPIVTGWPGNWTVDRSRRAEPDVEQATAGPGEKRGASKKHA